MKNLVNVAVQVSVITRLEKRKRRAEKGRGSRVLLMRDREGKD